jgi:hypothetical protein
VAMRVGLAPVGAADHGDQPVLDARDAAEEERDVAVVREVLDQRRDVLPRADAGDLRTVGVAADPASEGSR